MADTQLSLNFGIDSDAAVEGIEKVGTALDGVSEDLAKIKGPAADAAAGLDKVDAELQQVVKAAAALDKAGDSPKTLVRSSA